jgi:hypothetical protein
VKNILECPQISSESSGYWDNIIDIGDSRDQSGIEFEVDQIDEAMAGTGMKLVMNTINEGNKAVRSARAELT